MMRKQKDADQLCSNFKADQRLCVHYTDRKKGTSRQRSGKGAIRKKIPTPKTEAENKTIKKNQALIP